jgi:hypothetical protein
MSEARRFDQLGLRPVGGFISMLIFDVGCIHLFEIMWSRVRALA